MLHDPTLVSGAGGKSGGKFTEDPNTLKSTAYAQILDLISEGEIKGLVNGEQSVFLNDTPVLAADGTTYNFTGVQVAFVPGLPDQDYLPGFASIQEPDGTFETLETKYGVRNTRRIEDDEVNACVITIDIPALNVASDDGSKLQGTTVIHNVYVKSSADSDSAPAEVLAMTSTITGKNTSEFEQDYRIDLPGSGPWDVTVERMTADSDSVKLTNTTNWSKFQYIYDHKFTYPYSALMGIVVSSEYFGTSVPTRAYEVYGLIIQIPTNYDPITRQYTGLWDGTFKWAWTNNPAWVFYDLVTNVRYGAGIDPIYVDKWGLYQIAQYSDAVKADGSGNMVFEGVPDGLGGVEPRFTYNGVINKQDSVYTVLTSLASAFRGMTYWSAGLVAASQDRPADAVKIFTNANVIDGSFEYTGTSKNTRFTMAIVSWNNPANGYTIDYEVVEDREGMIKYGLRSTDVAAFGCTSRGQARRYGKWLLTTGALETDSVKFKTGFEGCDVVPGEIILVADPAYAGLRMGGRVLGVSQQSLQMDAVFTFKDGDEYELSIMTASGQLVTVQVANTPGATDVVALATALPADDLPIVGAIFTLSDVGNVEARPFQVLSCAESDNDNQYEIYALEHRSEKFEIVDYAANFDISAANVYQDLPNPNYCSPPANLQVRMEASTNAYGSVPQLVWTWDASKDTLLTGYMFAYRANSDNWTTMPLATDNSATIASPDAGEYDARVYAVNQFGVPSAVITATYHTDQATGTDGVTLVANLRQPDGGNTFTGAEADIIWDASPISAPTATPGQSFKDQFFGGFLVNVYNTDGTLLRSETVQDAAYTYSDVKNVADGNHRAFSIGVSMLNKSNIASNEVKISLSNEAPYFTVQPVATPAADAITVTATAPTDKDWLGIKIYASLTNPCVMNATTLQFYGSGEVGTFAELGDAEHYMFVVPYDVFGDGTPSNQITGTPNSLTKSIASLTTQVQDLTAEYGDADNGESAAQAAQDSANAASTSATNAQKALDDAQDAVTAAQAAESAAGSSAQQAANSAGNSSTSATNSSGSANSASNSATAAANSATASGNSANAASGSSSSAATSATAAGNSATSAQGYATAAKSSADGAATSAGASAGSASAASTNASAAAQSASSALTSSVTATLVVASSLPTDFQNGGSFWAGGTNTEAYYGAPTRASLVASSQVAFSGNTAILTPNTNTSLDISNLGAVTAVTGRTYSLTANYTLNTVSTGGTITLYLYGIFLMSGYDSQANIAVTAQPTVTGTGQMTFNLPAATVLAAKGSPTMFRALFRVSQPDGATGCKLTVNSILIDDVTDALTASGAASAAATSASTASAQNSAAGSSASAANTSATNAGTSATNAATSASQASTYSQSASGSATTASQNATLAANNASSAGNSASAANTSASNASTSASNAAASASAASSSSQNASTYAGNASTYASNANASAVLATNASTAATNSATVAASISLATINPNPTFNVYPDGAVFPTNWSAWSNANSGNTQRQTGVNGRPYSVYQTGDGTTDIGILVGGMRKTRGWFVIELDVRIKGSFIGLGVGFYSANEGLLLSCGRDPDINGVVRTTSDGDFYVYSWRKLVQSTQEDYGSVIYGFASYGSLAGTIAAGDNGNAGSRSVYWDRVDVRQATDGEVAGQRADVNASQALAQISSNQSAQASVNASQAQVNTNVNTTLGTNASNILSAQNAITTNYAATTQQVNTLSSYVNAGTNFAPALSSWTNNAVGFNPSSGTSWGDFVDGYVGQTVPTQLCISPKIPVDAGSTYVLSYDPICIGPSGSYVYMDFLAYDVNGNLTMDGPNGPLTDNATNFSDTRPRSTYSVSATLPAGTNYVLLRGVGYNPSTTGVLCGFRKVKFERGTTPTVYTDEGVSSSNYASIQVLQSTTTNLASRVNTAVFQISAQAGSSNGLLKITADGYGQSSIDLVAGSINLWTQNGASAVSALSIDANAQVHINNLAAGTISSYNLTVGQGNNLVYNAGGQMPFANAMQFNNSIPNDTTIYGKYTDPNYYLSDQSGYYVHQEGQTSTGYADIFFFNRGQAGLTVDYPVMANGRYEWSVYNDCHRCQSEVYIEWIDASGAHISFSEGGYGGPENAIGNTIVNYRRAGVIANAPSNAATARLCNRKLATIANQGDSYMFFARPLFAQCQNYYQTELSPWSAGSSTYIDATGIVTPSLSAITATIGTLRTATTGGRTEISDNVIKVYDANGVLRCQIGNLAL